MLGSDVMFWILNLLNFSSFDHSSSASSSSIPRPQVVRAFSSPISVYFRGKLNAQGVMNLDVDNHAENLTFVSKSQFGNYTQHSGSLLLKNMTFMLQNGRCELQTGVFSDPFIWLPLSAFTGTQTLGPEFDNRTCDIWTFRVPLKSNFSLCVENNKIPVLYNIDVNESAGSILPVEVYFHKDLNSTAPPASIFTPPNKCFVPDPPCADGNSTILDAFIFHPANVWDLNNENVADLLGDTVFICDDANNTAFDHYQWVSRYSIQVWSGWGQYALCNRPSPNQTGICTGQERYLVGREAPYGIIPQMCGQCTNNSDTGSWYSLLNAGQCNDGQVLGGDESKGECTWRVLKRLKTIDGICLLKTNGMLTKCMEEFDYPFSKSMDIFSRSFEYDDPSEGGCPSIA